MAQLQHASFTTLYLKGDLPAGAKKARNLVLESSRCAIIDGVLYYVDSSRQPRLAAPTSIYKYLLEENHFEIFSGRFSVKSL